MATIDYSPEEQAYIQEREAALKQQVATTPEPKAVTKKTTTVKDTNPSTLATVSDVQNTSAAPIDYGSLVSNVVSGYKDVKEKAPSVLESLDTSMPWLKYAAAALGILGAGALAYKAGGGGRPPNPPDDNNNGGRKSPSSIRDRSMIRIDPEMDVSRRMPDGRIEPTFGGPDSNRMVGGLFPADVSTKPAGPTPENPTVDLNTEIGKEPKGSEIVKKAAENPEKNAVLKGRQEAFNATVKSFERDAKGNIKYPEGMTPAAKAGAEAFAAQYPDQAKAFASKGQFGILGAGSSMNSLYNTWGENVAKQLRNELVSGNLLGGAQEYPGMLSKIAAIPPESATGKQLADIREKNPKGGTYGVLGKSVTMQEGKLIEGKNKVPGIVAKGMGPAVLLMAMADAAKANTLREGAGKLAEGVFNAVAHPGVGASELAPATLYTPEQQKEFTKQLAAQKEAERQKLGSPYRSVPPPR